MKSRWQQEFDALPEWARKLVRGMAGSPWYRVAVDHVAIAASGDRLSELFEGVGGARALAHALTAPWPPPEPPPRKVRALNVVEVIADGDCAFDQPCCFGHRVEQHAVYCHNEAWPDSPCKCHCNRDGFRHEDCPGFVANPDYRDPEALG